MTRSEITYKNKTYPVIDIQANLINNELPKSCNLIYRIADIELWFDIEEDVENGVDAAIHIDNTIYYYCDSGFVDSEPSEEDVIEYFNEEQDIIEHF